jgi:hypothetical protein
MQNVLSDARPRGSSVHGSCALELLATVLLSFGVGAATAAFTLLNAASPHSPPHVACATLLDLSGALPLAPLFAAGALAMLVACARGAARVLAEQRAPAIEAASALGALFVSAMLIDAFGMPAMGLRAAAFAICVSMLAARFARTARNDLVPTSA